MKASKILLHTLLIASSLLVGCSSHTAGPGEYVSHFNDPENGLVRETTYDHLSFIAEYVDKNFLAVKRCGGDMSTYLKQAEEIEDLTYFTVTIGSSKLKDPFYAGIKNTDDYYERTRYANTSIQNDFTLVYKGKSYPCRQVFFEPTHSVSKCVTLSLAFDHINGSGQFLDDLKLTYDDKLFNIGTMKFNFKKTDLNNIPSLKI